MTGEQERAAVVAWLRAEGERRNPFRMVQGDPVEAIIDVIADAIERGAHLTTPDTTP